MLLIKSKIFFYILLPITLSVFLFFHSLSAAAIDDLRQKISNKNNQIEQIQKEIEQYQKEIDSNSKKASSLSGKIKELEVVRKKLASDIKLTQAKIDSAKLNIEKLGIQIKSKSESIGEKKGYLKEFLNNFRENENVSAVEMSLAEDEWSDFLSDLEKNKDLQKEINSNVKDLKEIKADLESQKKEKESYKKTMEKLNASYSDQKQLVEINKKNTNQLLTETKNKETNYKKLLADRVAKQKAFEDEIKELEDELRQEIDPSALPKLGSGVLKWPLDKIKITQYFGNTSFAMANASVYNGGGHNGVDFKASIGTPVKASRSGVIVGIGDTDKACSGVSYGKWVLIQHENNLSTLYAHFSLIKVSQGQQVETGQLLGYSGDTGYATGPHLHFGVFATEGIKVASYKSKICGTNMILPVKTKKNAYLNPLDYL